ncbi:MAG: helix-turn-helix domain-containing protein [Pseudomonadota bacterium]
MAPNNAPKLTKGQRTAERVLDVAEELFADRGYDGTSLRQIAAGAGIREPGLYNHFPSKQALYEAVLYRALNPMAEVLARHLGTAPDLRTYTDLPGLMTDLLAEHPLIAALFQQAMQGDRDSIGNRLMMTWLDQLFRQGLQNLEESAPAKGVAREELALNVIAMFNLTTGYFLSQRAFDTMAAGSLQSPDNILRQKALLRKMMRAMLVG